MNGENHQVWRFALIGGGEGSFIGAVHKLAAELDGRGRLVAGCFSRDAETSRRSGVTRYGLDAARCYPSVDALLTGEKAQPESARAQFVVVATPNESHFAIARASLEAGFDVVCDKPMVISSTQAQSLTELVETSGRQMAVTYNYTGYPLIRQARQLVSDGMLGHVRRVQCEYLQGWLGQPEETQDNKQADWRTDPNRAGIAGCFGDIGTHAENLVRYVTGLQFESLCADLSTFVEGRRLDDDGSVLLRFVGGARGTLTASQIATGEENALTLRVYGDKGALSWAQQSPNSLHFSPLDGPVQVLRTAATPAGSMGVRLPPGHPEGFLEAFANVYAGFYEALSGGGGEFPGVREGAEGVRFVERVVESSQLGGVWVNW